MTEKHCIDCQKIISRWGTRCFVCNGKNTYANTVEKQKQSRTPMSEEGKKNMILSKKGIPRTLEVKEKIKKNHARYWLGKKNTATSGEKSAHWKGGVSVLPYSFDWTNTLRRSIRERDYYTCQICKEPQGDVAFDVHHIDYNKKNCSPINLITLCRKCHMKTNHKRSYWFDYFQLNLPRI